MKFTILEKRRFLIPSTIKCAPRKVKDYEIDYNYTGEREIFVDGIGYKIARGDICFRYPGQVVSAIGKQDSYLLTIDFTNTRDDENYRRNITGTQQAPYENELFQDLPMVIRPSDPNYFAQIFADIEASSHRNSPTTHMLFEELVFLIHACIRHNKYLQIQPSNKTADTIQQYITTHYNQTITLEDLARLSHLEKNYMVRLFKKEFSRTPIDYQISQRMYHARYLILNTTLTVKEVGEYCGYKTPALFIRHFKKAYGKTPLEYRKCNKNG